MKKYLIATLLTVMPCACGMADETTLDFTVTDPNIWMEEVESERSLSWVKKQNSRTLTQLQKDPVYADLFSKAEAIINIKERIPEGTIRHGEVYNFWQDADHVRGILRKTTWDSYQTPSPAWQTVLDIDQLAESEQKNWVYKGSECFTAHAAAGNVSVHCMMSLSDGGKDAAVQREFNLTEKRWVKDGFSLPEAKSYVAWLSPDQLLVATDWGSDGSTLSESGYPTEVKLWKRGTPAAEATLLYRGESADLGAFPMALRLAEGRYLAAAWREENFWESALYVYPDPAKPGIRVPLPRQLTHGGEFDGHFIFTTQQDWQPDGEKAPLFTAGSVLALDLNAFLAADRDARVSLLYQPGPRQAVQATQVEITRSAILVPVTDNVRGTLVKITHGEAGWQARTLDFPANGRLGIAFADADEDLALVQYEGFLTPDSLMSYNPVNDDIRTLKSLPVQFDASDLMVEQFEAPSSDGTLIPYFLVHKKDIPLDGTTPTLLYGYGGFQVSMQPFYSGLNGKLWLERGGAYVLANIRGGGEFGPQWHQAGLKTQRQIIYDDFIAVAEQLIAKKITTPQHLGIMGGSNGGLLMGVMLTQRPDLWNAVVIQVPLLDMLRYHLLLAGASWVGEYGSPDVPEERAWLEKMSPYHNFHSDKDYPEPFFLTSTKDDRVHPAHARKMAKRFDDAGKPFLYYENTDGGHSAAANLQEVAKRKALEFTYLTGKLMSQP